MGDRLNMLPATQVNSARPSLRGWALVVALAMHHGHNGTYSCRLTSLVREISSHPLSSRGHGTVHFYLYKTHVAYLAFSPASGGMQKARRLSRLSQTQGTMMLKT